MEINSNTTTSMLKLCRTCLQPIFDSHCYSLDSEESNTQATIRNKLNKCIPELNLNVIPDAVICNECFTSFDFAYKFRNKCLQAEEQIQNYLRKIFSATNFVEFMQDGQMQPMHSVFANKDFKIVDEVKMEQPDINIIKQEHIYVKEPQQQDINGEMVLHTTPQVIEFGDSYLDNYVKQLDNKSYMIRKLKINEYFQCYFCGRRYSAKAALIDHLRGCSLKDCPTNEQKLEYKCTDCTYTSAKESNLKYHIRVKHRDTPYICHTCGYRAIFRSGLAAHMKSHDYEKPFKCPECAFSSKFKQNLSVHMRIHTGEKPYKCLQCSYSTNHSSHLTIHKRVHTGERPYKCTECNYSTKHVSNLNSHRRVHTGEKAYKCSVCNYSCKQKISLHNHMKIHNTVWL